MNQGHPSAAGGMLLVLLAPLVICACAQYREQPLTADAVDHTLATPDDAGLRAATAAIRHPLLKPLPVDLAGPLTPDQAALLAVVLNPSLRAERDRRALSDAQIVQAGLLPNPEFSFSADHPVGGSTDGTVNAFGLGLTWDVSSLIGRGARIDAAQAQAESVALDVAWQEWQIAEGAKAAACRVLGVQQQIAAAERVDRAQRERQQRLQRNVALGEVVGGDLAAAAKDALDAQVMLLDLRQELARQRITLARFLGVAPERALALVAPALAERLMVPAAATLEAGLAERRLDLLALGRGYASQEAALRAAILAQFPKFSLGVQHARDTGNVVTTGFGVTLQIPIFDRNQGQIASETATRQQLFDAYANRLFEARSDLALALADLGGAGEAIAGARAALPGLEAYAAHCRAAVDHGDLDAATAEGAEVALALQRLGLAKSLQAWDEAHIALELAAGCAIDPAGTVMVAPVPSVAKEPTP